MAIYATNRLLPELAKAHRAYADSVVATAHVDITTTEGQELAEETERRRCRMVNLELAAYVARASGNQKQQQRLKNKLAKLLRPYRLDSPLND